MPLYEVSVRGTNMDTSRKLLESQGIVGIKWEGTDHHSCHVWSFFGNESDVTILALSADIIDIREVL